MNKDPFDNGRLKNALRLAWKCGAASGSAQWEKTPVKLAQVGCLGPYYPSEPASQHNLWAQGSSSRASLEAARFYFPQ